VLRIYNTTTNAEINFTSFTLTLHSASKNTVTSQNVLRVFECIVEFDQATNRLRHARFSSAFSDEKCFRVEEILNAQNDRVYAVRFESIPEKYRFVPRYQNKPAVMIFGAVSKKGKFPLHFVESNETVTAEYYETRILGPIVKDHGMAMFQGQRFVFQQDNAPAHRSKRCQQWCRRELPEFVSADEWPPMSPDLNPMDYSMWGVLEASVAARNVKSLHRLRRVVQEEWDKMPMTIVRAAIDSWPSRIRRCIRKRGGRFEK
jgi:inhibitor of nuclear factor kappa-B kinase subunit alpha